MTQTGFPGESHLMWLGLNEVFTFPVPVQWLGLSVSGKDMRYVFLYLPFEETSILGLKSKTVCSVSCKELNQAPGINRKKMCSGLPCPCRDRLMLLTGWNCKTISTVVVQWLISVEKYSFTLICWQLALCLGLPGVVQFTCLLFPFRISCLTNHHLCETDLLSVAR